MSVITQNTAVTPEPAAATPETIVEQLRAIRQQIPEFTQLPVSDTKAMLRVAHITPEFIDATINTIGASETVQNAIGRNDADLREEQNDVRRWTAVEDELRAMLRGVFAANLVRRHRVGLTVLQAYGITRQLVRQKEHANLLPHVQGMKRIPKFGRKRKTVQEAPVAPGPVMQP